MRINIEKNEENENDNTCHTSLITRGDNTRHQTCQIISPEKEAIFFIGSCNVVIEMGETSILFFGYDN